MKAITKAKEKVSPFPFLMNDTFISVILDDGPFSLNEAHPTFEELRKALTRKNWKKVPGLVSIAAKIANKSQGAVTVNSKGVFYKSRKVDSSLTQRMTTMLKENKDIAHMIKFMDNLYQNPSEEAIKDLFEFLRACQLPITDDGCFMAYKLVNSDYTDCHSGKFNNSPGQVLVMPRVEVDPDRQNTCSRGFHFCSKGYLGSFGGGRLMRVKINPKDVVSIPVDYGRAKGRTWRYEVVDELSDNKADWAGNQDHPVMIMSSVVEIAKERKQLLANILGHKTVKRAIYRGKWNDKSIKKWSYTQLTKFWNKLPHGVVASAPEQSKLFQNPLKVIREQAGLGLKEVAEEMDLSYKAIWAAERSTSLRQSTIDRYIEAVTALKGERTREKAIA